MYIDLRSVQSSLKLIACSHDIIRVALGTPLEQLFIEELLIIAPTYTMGDIELVDVMLDDFIELLQVQDELMGVHIDKMAICEIMYHLLAILEKSNRGQLSYIYKREFTGIVIEGRLAKLESETIFFDKIEESSDE